MDKMYYFSTRKHAHDIEFVYNRACLLYECIWTDGYECTEEEFDKLETVIDNLETLRTAVLNSEDGKVCKLTGKELGLARRTVDNADVLRSHCVGTSIKEFLRLIA